MAYYSDFSEDWGGSDVAVLSSGQRVYTVVGLTNTYKLELRAYDKNNAEVWSEGTLNAYYAAGVDIPNWQASLQALEDGTMLLYGAMRAPQHQTTLEFPLVELDDAMERVEVDGPNGGVGQAGLLVKMAPDYDTGF